MNRVEIWCFVRNNYGILNLEIILELYSLIFYLRVVFM